MPIGIPTTCLYSLVPNLIKMLSNKKVSATHNFDILTFSVSLTCICCKTLEHILVSNINKHLALDAFSILADCQHGFRGQRSCKTQLVQFVHDIVSHLDGAVNRGHKQTDLIKMDFAKALISCHKGGYYIN